MIKTKFKRNILLLTLLLSFGCQIEQPNQNKEPINKTSEVENDSKNSIESALEVFVLDKNNNKPLENVLILITSSQQSQKTAKTDSNGKVIFEGLVSGNDYNLKASLDGFLSNSISTKDLDIKVNNTKIETVSFLLQSSLVSISGKVIDENMEPIKTALVKINDESLFTNENGEFSLNSNIEKINSFAISKTGYKNLSLDQIKIVDQKIELKDIMLEKKIETNLLFDISKQPLGLNSNIKVSNEFTNFSSEIKNKGYSLDYADINLLEKELEDYSTIFIVSPAKEYSESEILTLKNYVKDGGKLVILAEWGGYRFFNVESINKLLQEANLKINIDLIEDQLSNSSNNTNKNITIKSFSEHHLTNNINSINLFGSSSIEVINSGFNSLNTDLTQILAFTSSSGFQIKDERKGQFGLLGASALGLGKIVVIGDTSLFMDVDSDKDNKENFLEEDNSTLLNNILTW